MVTLCGLTPAAVIVVGASYGVEVGTERVWEYCEARSLPRLFFVSMMDKEHANFEKVYQDIKARLTTKVVPVEIPIGQVTTVYYNVTNQSARSTTGQAAYNVAPLTVGAYFQKINCFCFTEQAMAPGEKREMPVVFYVDPALVADSENDGLNSITLSYTFYAVRDPAPKPVASGEPDKRKGSL